VLAQHGGASLVGRPVDGLMYRPDGTACGVTSEGVSVEVWPRDTAPPTELSPHWIRHSGGMGLGRLRDRCAGARARGGRDVLLGEI